MHDQNGVRAVIQHFHHFAQAFSLAVLLAKEAAADQIDPIKFVFVRFGESGTGYPNGMSLESLSQLSIIQTLKLRHDGCAMLLCGLYLSG